MPDKNQKMRYSEKELEIIKNTFAENEDILYALRKVMLQLPLNAVDLSLIEITFKGKKDVFTIIKKAFLPTITDDEPLNQLIDLWMTVRIEEKTPEVALAHLLARAKLIAYIEQQLEVLNGGKEKIKFDGFARIDVNDAVETYANITCRNTMIHHTDQQLQMLNILAGMKNETVEQTQSRLQKNSNK